MNKHFKYLLKKNIQCFKMLVAVDKHQHFKSFISEKSSYQA